MILTNLPLQLTSFIGREQEISYLQGLLKPNASDPTEGFRLVTLTGSGGTGKTRLALQLAHLLLKDFEDGVWLVELAALNDPSLVLQGVASAFSFKETNDQPLEQALIDYLKGRELLLLLDNCEHLVEECARLAATLLKSCPKLKILATSREALGTNGEKIFRVPSLTLPAPGTEVAVAALLEFEAVLFFTERAKLSNSNFALTVQNAPAVVSVCRRLDGIPLALELAAARTRVLTVEQINSRLDNRFTLLVSNQRTVLPRQQTLRALIEWSYNLLSSQEQVVLRRLAVFRGGCSLEAAEIVCAGEFAQPNGGGMVESWEVLDLLDELVNKSLLVAEEEHLEGGETLMRYQMLETIQEFAAHKLAEAGEVEKVKAQHTAWVLVLVEQADLRGSQQLAWLDRLEKDYPNIRLALQHTIEESQISAGSEKSYRLAAALCPFWLVRSYFKEGQYWLQKILAAPCSLGLLDPLLRSKVIKGAAVLENYAGGSPDRVTAMQQEYLKLQQETNNLAGVVAALLELAWSALHQLRLEEATSLSNQSLELARQLGDSYSLASALMLHALISSVNFCYPAVQNLVASGHTVSLSAFLQILYGYGQTSNCPEDVAHLEESLSLWQSLNDKDSLASAQQIASWVELARQNYAKAGDLLAESIQLLIEISNKYALFANVATLGLLMLASVPATDANITKLAQLIGAAEHLTAEYAMTPFPRYILHFKVVKTELEDRLGTSKFAALWNESQNVTYDNFLKLYRELLLSSLAAIKTASSEPTATALDTFVAAPAPTPSLSPQYPAKLTEREVEVIRLVAQGFTDAEVAIQLVLSPRTVNAHLRSIYNKLEVNSRREAVRFAQKNNLL